MPHCVWCLRADFVCCLLVSKRSVTRVHYSICLLVRLWLVVLLVIRSVFDWLFVWTRLGAGVGWLMSRLSDCRSVWLPAVCRCLPAFPLSVCPSEILSVCLVSVSVGRPVGWSIGVCVCSCACLLGWLCVCLYDWLCICLLACLLTWLLPCLLACLLVCLSACVLVCLLSCLLACLLTCLLTCRFRVCVGSCVCLIGCGWLVVCFCLFMCLFVCVCVCLLVRLLACLLA